MEGTNVTLTCSETMSLPPANTTWRKGQTQDPIVPGSKYALSLEGPVLKLTIVNISQEDERYYFCRSENALGVRELEVYLTVKSEFIVKGFCIYKVLWNAPTVMRGSSEQKVVQMVKRCNLEPVTTGVDSICGMLINLLLHPFHSFKSCHFLCSQRHPLHTLERWSVCS